LHLVGFFLASTLGKLTTTKSPVTVWTIVHWLDVDTIVTLLFTISRASSPNISKITLRVFIIKPR